MKNLKSVKTKPHPKSNRKAALLSKTVEHIDIKSFDARPIIKSMANMSFTSRDLGRACEIFNTMLKDKESTSILTLAGSTLLELASAGTRGTAYDAINAGTLTFGGTLTVSLLNGFTPTAGNSFDLLNYTTSSGTFSSLSLPTLTSGLTWNTSTLYTDGILSVSSSAIPEPSTYALLLGVSALALAACRRRQKKS